MNKQLEDLLTRVRNANDIDINKLYLEYQIITAMEKEEPKTYNGYQVSYSECFAQETTRDYQKDLVVEDHPKNVLELMEQWEREFISFGNYILQERFLKLCKVNEKFMEGILDLNPNFFSITDADTSNFKEQL